MSVQISTDKDQLDVGMLHEFLRDKLTWARQIDRRMVHTAIANSICFGAYEGESGRPVGFPHVITDCATFANLADVFVLEPYRAKGISR